MSLTSVTADYLTKTIVLAQQYRGSCAPNPAVGALVVYHHCIIGCGAHAGTGHPHAEVTALEQALRTVGQAGMAQSDLYISLEPCAHQGRTPPCVNAIIAAGIKRVFFGYLDPNPLVSGKGQAALRQAGIHCEHVSIPLIHHFYRSYHYWHTHHKPWITAKIALSLDEKIGLPGQSTPITHEAANQLTHQLRAQTDALLTTAKTIIADDPQFNARIDNKIISKPLYILDSRLTVPLDARIWQTAKNLTLFHHETVNLEKQRIYQKNNARCIPISHSENSALLDINAILSHLGQDGIHDVWMEVGSTCFNTWLQQQKINELYCYISSRIIGPDGHALARASHTHQASLGATVQTYFKNATWSTLGSDILGHFD